MTDRHYLWKVLGLSAIPRLLTFLLTLISLPLMVRALGAEQYGIIVYLQSVTGLLELAATIGVSSAAGKGIATCRAVQPHRLAYEVSQWARLQTIVALVSVIPVFGIGYFLISKMGNGSIGGIEFGIFVAVTSTLYAAVGATFVRMVLQSLLAFKALAALDTIESIARSGGWLVVAWLFPTALGLAIASLITSCLASLVGIGVLVLIVRRQATTISEVRLDVNIKAPLALRHMLKESMSFMGLLLGTRAYQTIPNILVARLLGLEIVGVIGAFVRIVELVALPFTVIGNALMVRAQEVKSRGIEIVNRYWDMLGRFVIVAMAVVCAFWFVSHDVARVLLPRSPDAVALFGIMTPLVFLRAVSDLFAPASDYVGGLRSRVVFLLICAGLQLPFIWAFSQMYGEVGAVAAIVGSYTAMVLGYIWIARRVFFGRAVYVPPKDVFMALSIILGSVGLAVLFASDGQVGVMIYIAMSAIGFLSVPLLRRNYASGSFMKFELA